MLIIVTILINVGAIAVWSFITGQNGFKEAAKMLRGEAAFIRDTTTSSEKPSISEPPPTAAEAPLDELPPTSTRRTGRPNVYDPRFGRHPSEFYD